MSRTKNQRRRLFAGLTRDLLIHDRITTSLAKAKAVQPMIEKFITKAKDGSDANFRRVMSALTDRKIVKQLFDDAKTRFSGRKSGFTRIIKVGSRMGDAGDRAMLSFVDDRVVVEIVKPESKSPKQPKVPRLPKKV